VVAAVVDLAEAVATAAGKWWSTIEVHKTKQNLFY